MSALHGKKTFSLGKSVHIWKKEPMFPEGGFLIEGKLSREGDHAVLTITCPNCRGGIDIRSNCTSMRTEPGRGLSVARFGCSWGTRQNPCGWNGELVPPPPGFQVRDGERLIPVDAVIH